MNAHHRRVRRWLFIYASMIILGAISTVVVALLCLTLSDAKHDTDPEISYTPEELTWINDHGFFVPDAWPPERYDGFGFHADAYFDLLSLDDRRVKVEFVWRNRVGWPLQAFFGNSWDIATWDEILDEFVESHSEYEAAIPIDVEVSLLERIRRIPIGIIWWGLMLDVLFYAVIFWLLLCGFYFLRRRLRLVYHCCPMCGYPARTSSPVCTECGYELMSMAKTPSGVSIITLAKDTWVLDHEITAG